jgi:hypothetical protein
MILPNSELGARVGVGSGVQTPSLVQARESEMHLDGDVQTLREKKTKGMSLRRNW